MKPNHITLILIIAVISICILGGSGYKCIRSELNRLKTQQESILVKQNAIYIMLAKIYPEKAGMLVLVTKKTRNPDLKGKSCLIAKK